MAILSPVRDAVPLLEGLELLNRGKVRDTYRLPPRPGGKQKLLLVVATDGISIFDFVLNGLIPDKGYVLTAMTHFWLTFLESTGIKTHFVAAGARIDEYLPEHLRGDTDLQRRAMVVVELEMIPIEFIARFCLTGSVLREYAERGTVYGTPMPPSLKDGDMLPEILFTPTTKANDGHDEPMDANSVRANYRSETAVFLAACERCVPIARERGIVIADTKGELGYDDKRVIRVGDEWLTADSSRFWDSVEHTATRTLPDRKAPSPFDKQLVRAFGIERGINTFDPKNDDDVTYAHRLQLPRDIAEATTRTYRYIFWRLTGISIEEYARVHLGVCVPDSGKNVTLVFGSASDIPQMKGVLESIQTTKLARGIASWRAHVISCHRNHRALTDFVERGCDKADVVIAIAGKAAALPGMLDAIIHEHRLDIPVIGVGVGEPGSTSWTAAKLSIEELPGSPVVLDEARGEAYMGPEGLRAALERIAFGELPPKKKRAEKDALFDLDISTF